MSTQISRHPLTASLGCAREHEQAFDIARFKEHGECVHILEDLKTRIASQLGEEDDELEDGLV